MRKKYFSNSWCCVVFSELKMKLDIIIIATSCHHLGILEQSTLMKNIYLPKAGSGSSHHFSKFMIHWIRGKPLEESTLFILFESTSRRIVKFFVLILSGFFADRDIWLVMAFICIGSFCVEYTHQISLKIRRNSNKTETEKYCKKCWP